ncbi:pyroglutamyl-peptidase I [Pseudarthrobacter sp. J1738]|uniref:pyroglutamyl-peptidase I n=1 Tax=Pseudarthrobacter sp. J1738 TaxID=3420446 RepID=UPI003D288255
MILLTGFEPFNGATMNPSWVAAQSAADQLNAQGIATAAIELKCVFGESASQLKAAISTHNPDVVICVGQAGGTKAIRVERVAVNLDDAPIPDNAGNQPIDIPVVQNGPAAYFSGLPVKALAQAIRDAGIPAVVSASAGSYVCNHVFYSLMHQIQEVPHLRGGFIHVPLATEQLSTEQLSPEQLEPEQGALTQSGTNNTSPSLPLESISAALVTAVHTLVSGNSELHYPAGSTH